jgi:uncharacterized protein (TIGR00730 family)
MYRVCVFAAAREGNNPRHLEASRALGTELGRRGLGMVYGGANRGLMTACADAALAAGADVTGVLPRTLGDRELAHTGLTELRIVKNLHERKAVMSALSDAVVALPGGVGTLEELFEVITWRYLDLNTHPIGLLDADGYWQPLLRFLESSVAAGLIDAALLASLVVRSDAAALLDALVPAKVAERSQREKAEGVV